MKKIYFYLVGLTVLASCSTVTKVTNSNTNEMQTHESGVVMRPLLADVTVSESRKSVEYIVPYYMSAKKDGKENALLNFKKTHKCDYVVDPIFEITTETGKKNVTKIVLSGYAATYSNIRQVDSLPKSIVQYNLMHKPVKALDYLNTFQEIQPTMGFEVSTLAYNGLQFDKILSNSNNRFYVAAEIYGLLGGIESTISADFIDKSNNLLIAKLNNKGLESYNTLSAGLMREFPVFSILKFRILGGVNVLFGKTNYIDAYDLSYTTSYDWLSSNSEQNRFFSLGIRAGAGVDIKIYKSLSAIAKIHYNQNIVKVLSKPSFTFESYTNSTWQEVDEHKIKKVKFENTSLINLSVGLRISF
jgi:hypothetical protein